MGGRVRGRRELESGPGLTRLPFEQDEVQARRVDRKEATKAIIGSTRVSSDCEPAREGGQGVGQTQARRR